jgi:glycosyltransferase involved in cell wall biosynthesis
MKIGIDIRCACGKKAGIGTNFFELVIHLGMIDKNNNYFLYTRHPFEYASKLPQNMSIVLFKLPIVLWHPVVALHARIKGVHAFLTHSNITSMFLNKKGLILYIPDISGLVLASYHTLKVLLLSQLDRIFARKAAAILTISEFSREEIIRHLGVDRNTVFVTLLAASEEFRPVDESVLSMWKKELQLPERFILFVGSLEPRKNIMSLLKAILLLKKTSRTKLVIAGGSGWKNSDVYEFIKENNLSESVTFTGYVSRDALVALYNLADVFVFPSKYEGFGLPVLEAMACGCPVICSNTSSLPEVAGDAAIEIDPDNPAIIADAIVKVTMDENVRARFRERSFEQARSFSWISTAEQTLRLFNQFIRN